MKHLNKLDKLCRLPSSHVRALRNHQTSGGKKMAIGKVEDENSNIFTSFPWHHGSTVARILRRAPSMDLGVHWVMHLWMFIIEYNARKCTPKYWKKVDSSTNEIEVKLRSDIQFQNGLFQVPCFYPLLSFFSFSSSDMLRCKSAYRFKCIDDIATMI